MSSLRFIILFKLIESINSTCALLLERWCTLDVNNIQFSSEITCEKEANCGYLLTNVFYVVRSTFPGQSKVLLHMPCHALNICIQLLF